MSSEVHGSDIPRSETPAYPRDGGSPDDGRMVRRGLWVAFESAALEDEYWRASRDRVCTLSAAYVGAVLVGLIIFSVDGYRLLGWTVEFARHSAVRLALVVISAITFQRIRRQPPRRHLEWLLMLWALAMVAGHGVLTSERPVEYLVSTVNGRAILLLGFLMVPSPWAVLTPAGVLLSVIYSAFIIAGAPPGQYQALLVSSTSLFAVMNVLGCFWAVQHERAQRRHFATLRAETRLREALAAAKVAADQSNRAKSDFLATMSHEIRTPMNGVLGFANLLAETELTDEQRRYVATIRGSGETLLAIIDDILDFSKVEAGQLLVERIPYDLRQTVRELMDLMSLRAGEKQIAVSWHVDDDVPPRPVGDPGRLRQVLLNLVGNALKFTESGHVRVAVTRAGDGLLRLAVIDTGIGLSQDEMGGLFQRFSQADASTTRRFGGTGLGLAICKRLVELMGGTIGVESRKGHGSTFWFTVPLAPAGLVHAEPAPEVAAAEAPDALATLRAEGLALRVLLAEDNVTNQFLARRLLTQLGCTVDLAVNGREAVEMWRRARYDAILMDCQMPEMDGFAATVEIRRAEGTNGAAERPSRVHIVACSAGVTPSERAKCAAAGMDHFVAKPLSRDDLRHALQGAAAAAMQLTAA